MKYENFDVNMTATFKQVLKTKRFNFICILVKRAVTNKCIVRIKII